MKNLLGRAKNSQFLRHNAVYFSGSFIAAALNYLFYPVLGRMLKPADFGEVQTILSFFMQGAVFLQVIGLIALGVIKKHADEGERGLVMGELERIALYGGVGILIISLLASVFLQGFFQFSSPLPFVLLAIALFISIPAAFNNAFLQGFQKFALLARVGLIGAGGKLALATALVAAGLRTVGAVLGVVLSQALAFIYSFSAAKKLGRPRLKFSLAKANLATVKPEIPYAIMVLAVSLSINILVGLDIISIKHYFSPHEAGLYAGISTIARIIFFLTGPLTIVLVSSVKLGDNHHNRPLLLRSAALQLLLGGSALIAISVAPELAISVLLGGKYIEYASLLPQLALAMFLLSTANLVVYYFMALRQAWIGPVSLLGLAATAGLIYIHHPTVGSVVTSITQGSLILLVLVGMGAIWQSRRNA